MPSRRGFGYQGQRHVAALAQKRYVSSGGILNPHKIHMGLQVHHARCIGTDQPAR